MQKIEVKKKKIKENKSVFCSHHILLGWIVSALPTFAAIIFLFSTSSFSSSQKHKRWSPSCLSLFEKLFVEWAPTLSLSLFKVKIKEHFAVNIGKWRFQFLIYVLLVVPTPTVCYLCPRCANVLLNFTWSSFYSILILFILNV